MKGIRVLSRRAGIRRRRLGGSRDGVAEDGGDAPEEEGEPGEHEGEDRGVGVPGVGDEVDLAAAGEDFAGPVLELAGAAAEQDVSGPGEGDEEGDGGGEEEEG